MDGITTKGKQRMQWRTARASVIGTGHIRANMPCQDSNYVMQIGDSVIIAVSDGLGSAAYSDVGSKFVCQDVVTRIANSLTPPKSSLMSSISHFILGTAQAQLVMQDIMTDAVTQARAALEELATTNQHALRDYACTLLIAVLTPKEWHVLHIGDGAVVGIISTTEVKTLSAPDNGEFINVTVPLTSNEYRTNLRYSHGADELYGIALLSDGVQPMCINYQTNAAFPGFFTPLIQWLAELPESELAQAHPVLTTLLDSDKLRQKSDDDMTLVLTLRLHAPS